MYVELKARPTCWFERLLALAKSGQTESSTCRAPVTAAATAPARRKCDASVCEAAQRETSCRHDPWDHLAGIHAVPPTRQ